MRRRTVISCWHLLAPLPATIIGAIVMRSSDIPSVVWMQNLIAIALALAFVIPLWLRGAKGALSPSSVRWMAAGCLALLALTLAQPGIDGVQRWIALGPLNLHASAFVLPLLLVLLPTLAPRGAAIAAVSAATLLLLQPDAGQACAFAAGWIAISLHRRQASIVCATAVIVLAAVGAILRGDPLHPVPHVEAIVGLTSNLGPVWYAVALASLSLPPVALMWSHRQPATIVLGLYVAATLVAAWMGHFPVPFMGYGVAPILGYYAALGTMLFVDPARPRASLPDASHSVTPQPSLPAEG